MDQIDIFVILFSIIAIVGVIFRKSTIPISLLLVIIGMLISFLPNFPHIGISPVLVLDVFLPLLIYETSIYTSWRDLKKNFRAISLLSVGHVIFIAIAVAITIHLMLPELGWPLAFVLGAVISPPDDVAIVSIAAKIHMPRRIVTILTGEGMLNDATALILFRFSLAAVVTHQFSATAAVTTFFLVVISEIVYGLILGYLLGEIRLKVREPALQTIISVLTPFLAYLPASHFGGCGVIATVTTGMLIGHRYAERFPPEVRLTARSVWTTLGFAVQSIIFLLVGLDLRSIIARVSTIPTPSLALYSIATILVVILGRFVWVYAATYLPRLLFPAIAKKDPFPPWQYPFIVAWSGMRGGISLAAAVAVPILPATMNVSSPKDLLLFLVFCVITATLLLQGLALPWFLKLLGIHTHAQREKQLDRMAELKARYTITRTVLRWLTEYKELNHNNPEFCEEIQFHLREYQALKKQLSKKISYHDKTLEDKNSEQSKQAILGEAVFLATQIIEVERAQVVKLWNTGKINHSVKNKLVQQLDLRFKHLSEA